MKIPLGTYSRNFWKNVEAAYSYRLLAFDSFPFSWANSKSFWNIYLLVTKLRLFEECSLETSRDARLDIYAMPNCLQLDVQHHYTTLHYTIMNITSASGKVVCLCCYYNTGFGSTPAAVIKTETHQIPVTSFVDLAAIEDPNPSSSPFSNSYIVIHI